MTYREFAPAPALRGLVRRFFAFSPGAPARPDRRTVIREVAFTDEASFCSPMFADGHASIVIDLGGACELGLGWTFGGRPRARVIGPLRSVGAQPDAVRPQMVGAYLAPAAAGVLLGAPAIALTDHVADLNDFWGPAGAALAQALCEVNEAACVDRLETALVARAQAAAPRSYSLDICGLARRIRADPASGAVRRLADAAGVSRQHLTRQFREAVGVGPKRYGRIARFQAGLHYAQAGVEVDWAQAAVELGYADQSHMIAEFRELSSLTPHALAANRWFHPFILDSIARHREPGACAHQARVA